VIPLAARLSEIALASEPPSKPVLVSTRCQPPEELGIIARKLEEAFEHGRLAGEAAARQDIALMLEKERERLEHELEAQRQSWAEQQADRLSEHVSRAVSELEFRLADQVGAVLEPFIEDTLKRKAIDEFRALAASLLKDQPEAIFVMRAPKDLADAISRKLGPLAAKVDFVISDTCDIQASSGMGVFEARLSNWLAGLKEHAA
jgi:hypothetical protein